MSTPNRAALVFLQPARAPAVYSSVASVAVLIYDWFLTIDSELAFIWDPKWNLGTLLYFLTRYPAFVDTAVYLYSVTGYHIPPPVCNIVVSMSVWTFQFGILIAEVIMMVCVWAMWGRGRKMAIFLLAILASAAVVSATLPVRLLQYRSPATYAPPKDLPPDALGCQDVTTTGVGTHNRTFVGFVALASLEVVLFFLVLSKAVEHSRSHSSTFVIECFRHGLLYYVVLSVLSVINLAIVLRTAQGSDDPLLSIQRVFHAILSARMLLHLRRSARQTSGTNTSSTSPGSDIAFQDGSNSTGDGASDGGRMSVT